MSDRNFDEHKWDTGWLKDHGYKPFPADRKGFHFHDHDDRGAGVRDIHNTFGETKFRHFDWIPYMKYWCYKVLPLAYDDSLSYYEVLCKCIGKLNEVIECMDNLPEIVYEMALHGYLLDNLMENICPLNDHSNEITTADRHEGELIWLDGDLYTVTRDMLAGERYVLPDTEGATANISRVTFEGFVRCLTDNMKEGITFNNEDWNHTFKKAYVIGDLLWWKDNLYYVDKDIAIGDNLETAVADGKMHQIAIADWIRLLVGNLKKAINVPDEEYRVTYSQAYTEGDMLWWYDQLYIVTSDITKGATIDTSKMKLVNMKDWNDTEHDKIRYGIAIPNEHYRHTYSQSYTEGDLLWWKGELYIATKDIPSGATISTSYMKKWSLENKSDDEDDKIRGSIADANQEYNHTSDTAYGRGTIVWWKGETYLVDKDMPKGTNLDTAESEGYWHKITIEQKHNDDEDNTRGGVSEHDEGENHTASVAYSRGQLVWWRGNLYIVDKDIPKGTNLDTAEQNGYWHKTSMEQKHNDDEDDTRGGTSGNNEHENHTSANAYTRGQLVWWMGNLYIVDKDIPVGTNLDTAEANGYWHKTTMEQEQKGDDSGTQGGITVNNEENNYYTNEAYHVGTLIWWRNNLYRIIKEMPKGTALDTAVASGYMVRITFEDLLEEERKARKDADDAEKKAREDADKNLQDQITSNDNDIANHEGRITTLEECCTDAKKKIQDNSDDIDGIKNQIDSGTNPSGVRDTNTLTQLTYHEWRGTVWGGDTGITELAGMQEAAKKVDEIIAAGGHAELCRIQKYGHPNNDPANMGLQGSEYLNQQSTGAYRYQTSGGSSIEQDCGITDTTISQDSSKCIERSWYFSYNNGSGGTWNYTKANLTDTASGGWFWQYRLIYQTADYINAN